MHKRFYQSLTTLILLFTLMTSFTPQSQAQGIPLKNLLGKGILSGIYLFTAQSLIAQGVANVANLETLRHGTSANNYLGIQCSGGDPIKGGNASGSATFTNQASYIQNSLNYFHVFRDFPASDPLRRNKVKTLPRMHAVFAGANLGGSLKNIYQLNALHALGGVTGLLTPTVKFYFLPEDIKKQFIIDKDYEGLALKTSQKISFEHMGIAGAFRQGLKNLENEKWKEGDKKLEGSGQLLLGSYFSYKAIRKILNQPISCEITPGQKTLKEKIWKCAVKGAKGLSIFYLVLYSHLFS